MTSGALVRIHYVRGVLGPLVWAPVLGAVAGVIVVLLDRYRAARAAGAPVVALEAPEMSTSCGRSAARRDWAPSPSPC